MKGKKKSSRSPRKKAFATQNNSISRISAAGSGAVRSYNPQETFQLIFDVDNKLANKKGLFYDDEHEAKRQILLQRAAEAKKRLEAQQKAALQAKDVGNSPPAKRANFELIEDCKFAAMTYLKLTYHLMHFVVVT